MAWARKVGFRSVEPGADLGQQGAARRIDAMLEHQERRRAVAPQDVDRGAVEIGIEQRIDEEAVGADGLRHLIHHAVGEGRRQFAPFGREERDRQIDRPGRQAVGNAREPRNQGGQKNSRRADAGTVGASGPRLAGRFSAAPVFGAREHAHEELRRAQAVACPSGNANGMRGKVS